MTLNDLLSCDFGITEKASMNCIGINQFDGEYIIGAGKGDTTGPVAGVNMMGYAMPSQIASGLHGRLYARSGLILRNING